MDQATELYGKLYYKRVEPDNPLPEGASLYYRETVWPDERTKRAKELVEIAMDTLRLVLDKGVSVEADVRILADAVPNNDGEWRCRELTGMKHLVLRVGWAEESDDEIEARIEKFILGCIEKRKAKQAIA